MTCLFLLFLLCVCHPQHILVWKSVSRETSFSSHVNRWEMLTTGSLCHGFHEEESACCHMMDARAVGADWRREPSYGFQGMFFSSRFKRKVHLQLRYITALLLRRLSESPCVLIFQQTQCGPWGGKLMDLYHEGNTVCPVCPDWGKGYNFTTGSV